MTMKKRDKNGSNLLSSVLRLALLAGMAFGAISPAHAAGAADSKTVLILDTSVMGGLGSPEAVQASALGFTVELATEAVWAGKSQADFATYRALVLGDATCSDLSSINAAILNRTTWGPATNGNIILIGGDPEYHASMQVGATTLIKNSIGFAGDVAGKTGLYAAFGCAYGGAPESGTTVAFLDPFGSFAVRDLSTDAVHMVASHPAFAGLTDVLLSNWGSSTHAGFTSFPAGFIPLAIQDGQTGNGALKFSDGSSGVPFLLARGQGLVAIGDTVPVPTLSEWGLIMLSGLIGLFGLAKARRRGDKLRV